MPFGMKRSKKEQSIHTRRSSVSSLLSKSLIILVVCITICIFHVSGVRNTFENEVRSGFLRNLSLVSDVLSQDMHSMDEKSKIVTAAVMKETVNGTDESILAVLSKYKECYGFTTVAFFDTNCKVYYEGETFTVSNIYTELSKIRNFQNGFFRMMELSYGEDRSRLVRLIPIGNGDKLTGYLYIDQSVEDIFQAQELTNLTELGSCVLINGSGEILAYSENAKPIFNGYQLFFDALNKYSDQASTTRSDIRYFQNRLVRTDEAYLNINTSKGYSMMVAYEKIKGIESLYLVSCYNNNLIEDTISSVVFESVLTCVLITSLLVALIFYVWYTSKKSSTIIERLAYEDEVTGGRNFNYFRDRAVEIIAEHRETPFLIYRFDIANFRYINEAYGHQKADDTLRACIQEYSKYFNDKEICVRMNSDQFLALAVNDATIDQRRQNYIEAINECARTAGVRYPIRLKIGIYQVRKHDYDIDVMIDHANAARKSLTGEEKILEAVYSDTIMLGMKKINTIESEMQKALNENEFKVFLQPKWDILHDCIAGAEALVRWIKPNGDIVYPNDFIPLFEKNGFIEKLDFYMLESVCRKMKELLDEGRIVYPISINQSRLLLHNPDYIKNIEKIIKRYQVPVKYLELEITETVFFSERSKMISIMNQLKEQNITLAMDDFGSGYSSLNILKDIPFDVLKIDRDFFDESITSDSSILILEKVIEMAKGLGIKVICEGVESADQIDILKRIGCSLVQGYYYGRPMPFGEFIEKYCKMEKEVN